MVELEIKSGDTEKTKNVILSILAEATPEKVAEVSVQEKENQTQKSKACHLSIILHLDGERKNGKYSLASAGDIQIITDEFTCGYNGTGPHNLLEVLRGAGITDKMLPDESILGPASKPLRVRFSSRYYSYGKLREVTPPGEPELM